MAEDVDDDEDDRPPRRRAHDPKSESRIGNILEAIFTYGASFFIYLPINALLIFGPVEMDITSPTFWGLWVALSLSVDAGNAIAANTGIQSKFAGKTMRLFVDFLSSISPLLLPILMIVLTITGSYEASRADCLIAILMSWFALNDVCGRSNVVHTALRRVREVARDV